MKTRLTATLIVTLVMAGSLQVLAQEPQGRMRWERQDGPPVEFLRQPGLPGMQGLHVQGDAGFVF
ncbi:MAG TPA: hypothetical protein VG778_12610, partial [Blastocatellia bacterium]|nr:hypothetical protein [Blastocatellia bacterium]